MREFIFVYLFGMLFLTGGFLSVFWGRMAKRRWSALRNARDRVFLISSVFATGSVGLMFVSIGRLVGNVNHGLSAIALGFEGNFVTFGLLLLLLSQIGMVWLADLERPRPLWLAGMAALSILWAIACLFLTGEIV